MEIQTFLIFELRTEKVMANSCQGSEPRSYSEPQRTFR
jgi:hypothetical protein